MVAQSPAGEPALLAKSFIVQEDKMYRDVQRVASTAVGTSSSSSRLLDA